MSATNSDLDQKRQLLREKLNALQKLTESHRENVGQRRLIVSQYCDNLRSEVDLATQSAIEQLNRQNQEMLDEIAKYEQNLLDLMEPKTAAKDEKAKPEDDYDQLVLSNTDEFVRKTSAALTESTDIGLQGVEAKLNVLQEMASELQEAVDSFHRRIFAKKYMHFIENEKFFSELSNVGHLESFPGGVLKPKTSYLSQTKGITHLALMPNGDVLSGCKNGDVLVWSPDFKTVLHKSVHDLHLEEVTAIVALSNDRFACAFNSIERCIRVYQFDDTGRFFLFTSLYEHSDYISGLCALSNGDLLSCSYDGTILLRSSSFGFVSTKQIGEFGERSIFCMAVLSDSLIAISDSLVPLRIYSLAENKTLTELFNLSPYFTSLSALGPAQLVSSSFGTIKVWDYNSGKTNEIFFGDRDDHAPLLALKDGSIASCNLNSHIDVWDSSNGALKRLFPSYGSKLSCMIQLKNGDLLTVYRDNIVSVWKI